MKTTKAKRWWAQESEPIRPSWVKAQRSLANGWHRKAKESSRKDPGVAVWGEEVEEEEEKKSKHHKPGLAIHWWRCCVAAERVCGGDADGWRYMNIAWHSLAVVRSRLVGDWSKISASVWGGTERQTVNTGRNGHCEYLTNTSVRLLSLNELLNTNEITIRTNFRQHSIF